MNKFAKIALLVVGFGLLAVALDQFHPGTSQAAGSAPVLVTNTPLPVTGNVQITGTPTVISADDPERSVYAKTEQTFNCTLPGFCQVKFPAVPSGQRLVVTYVSAFITLQGAGTVGAPYLTSNIGGAPPPGISLRVSSQGLNLNNDTEYVLDSQVRWYYDGGLTPELNLGISTPATGGRLVGTLVGYLIDCTTRTCNANAVSN